MPVEPLPDLPARGDDPWDTRLHARINAVQTRADAALSALPVDAGGNTVIPFGSSFAIHSPDGSTWQLAMSNAGVASWTKVTTAAPLPGNPGDTGGGTTPATTDPNLLTIGAHTHAINGTNIYRDLDFLVRYTYSTTQTVSPANFWGVEVVVNATTNVVVSVNNRQLTSSAAGTPIGSGQYLLSGHGLGTGTSGQFLLDYATVGATMALSGNGGAPTGGGGTGTPVTPGVTGKIFAYWYQIFRTPKINAISSTAMSHVNEVSIALLQSGQVGTGKLALNIPNGTNTSTRAEVTSQVNTWRTAGKNVLMCFGGSSDGGITITNNTQADQAFDSFVALKEDASNPINFNGIDVDLEPSGSSWTQDPLIRLITKLKQRYGSDFIIALTPGLYGEYTAKWMALAQALGSNFTYMRPMLYDFPESTTYAALMPVVRDKMATMDAAGIAASKIMLGLMLQPYSGYSASPSTVISQVVQRALVEYPTLRGVVLWEHSIDAAQSYPVALGPVPGYLGL